jgi:hypothetical protein
MNTANKTIIAVVGILAVAGLIAFYIWSSHNRFYILSASQGVAYEVDRKTGQSWMLRGARKIAQHGDEESHQKDQELPFEEAAKITGNAGIGYGYFSGKLYNGIAWTVTRVILSVSAKDASGTTKWSRDVSTSVSIKPLTTASFTIAVTGDEGIKEAPWNIKSVFGIRE